ncbi:hypothetical protein BSL78_09904 [Apostichopus japonicus]|uniref:DUF6729 domain-containing protein n=1 Tax=Stichopus japonicus TaxID=307972 RepID=A0A2G8KYU8_STIJA|nr:hypothetical protein BSL78_09904 [Apostichopus japonicus]
MLSTVVYSLSLLIGRESTVVYNFSLLIGRESTVRAYHYEASFPARPLVRRDLVQCPQFSTVQCPLSILNFWHPVGVWGYSLKCPRNNCPARDREVAFLYRCGYANTVRYICDISDWYCMLTEVLACSACSCQGICFPLYRPVPRLDSLIISQLTLAHQTMFPAILTLRRGVDKQVVRLMTDRTAANSMASIWRQVQENHCEKYLHRKDIYSTLLTSLTKEGSLLNTIRHKFQPPPQCRELPSAKLLRKALLIGEAENI